MANENLSLQQRVQELTHLYQNSNKEVEFLKTRIDAVTQDTQLLSDRIKEENLQTLETKVTEVEQENHDL